MPVCYGEENCLAIIKRRIKSKQTMKKEVCASERCIKIVPPPFYLYTTIKRDVFQVLGLVDSFANKMQKKEFNVQQRKR